MYFRVDCTPDTTKDESESTSQKRWNAAYVLVNSTDAKIHVLQKSANLFCPARFESSHYVEI